MRTPSYSRSQVIWPVWLALPAAAVLLASGIVGVDPAEPRWLPLAVIGAAAMAVAVAGRLRVEVDGACVEWQFGFLGWPRWRLPLARIAGIEVIRTRWIDGWGIRRGREGWLYNATGFAAVRIRTVDGRSIRLGSDEPDRLASFVQARLPARL